MKIQQPNRAGVTLIEISVSLVLISTVMLVSLTASANLLSNTAQRRAKIDGEDLAGQILDEISALDFRDRDTPVYGIEADETAGDRTTFDDVDDYHLYSSNPPAHRDGTAIAGYEGWSFNVIITPAEPDATGIVLSNDIQMPMRVISVYCTAPDGTVIDAATLVSDVASNIPDSDSFDQWRRLTLQFSDRDIVITAPLRNAPDSF